MNSKDSFNYKSHRTESSESSSNSEEIKKYVVQFKKEIEKKFKKSSSNKGYKFPRKTHKVPKNNKIFNSLSKVNFYDLESQNVKKYILNLNKSKKNSNSSILMKLVKKLGSLDERYLQSQFKDTRSDFFKMLYKNVVRIKKSEIKKKRKKINKTTIFFPQDIKSLRKKNTSSNFYKKKKSCSNSKISKLAPILGYINIKEKKTLKKRIKRKKTKTGRKKIKSFEQKNYINKKNGLSQKKIKNKSFKSIKKTSFSIKVPKTTRSHRYLKKHILQQTKLKLADYFKFEENKENIKKKNLNISHNLNLVLPVNKSDLKSLIEKKLCEKNRKSKRKNKSIRLKKNNKLTLKKFQTKIASIYSNKTLSKGKLNTCRIGLI